MCVYIYLDDARLDESEGVGLVRVDLQDGGILHHAALPVVHMTHTHKHTHTKHTNTQTYIYIIILYRERGRGREVVRGNVCTHIQIYTYTEREGEEERW